MELYDYPGGHGRKYDGISSSGGAQDGELNQTETDRDTNVKLMMESLDAQVNVVNGESDCSSLTAGFRFELLNHPNGDNNRQYAITTVTHEAVRSEERRVG